MKRAAVVLVGAVAAIGIGVGGYQIVCYIDDWRFCNQANNLGGRWTPSALIELAMREGRPARGPFEFNGVQYPADPPYHLPYFGDIALRYVKVCI